MHTGKTGKKRRGRLRRWWASGAPDDGDWHWIAYIGGGVGLFLAVLVVLAVMFGTHGNGDTNARLFTYRDGRLDVDVLNVAALVAALRFAWGLFGHRSYGD